MLCSALRFHSALTYPWTLNIFSLVAFGWVRAEITYYQIRRPWRILELGGAFSYSIYLVHGIAVTIAWRVGALSNPLDIRQMAIRLIWVLAISYCFYRVIERPAHELARASYRWLAATRAKLQSRPEGVQ